MDQTNVRFVSLKKNNFLLLYCIDQQCAMLIFLALPLSVEKWVKKFAFVLSKKRHNHQCVFLQHIYSSATLLGAIFPDLLPQ